MTLLESEIPAHSHGLKCSSTSTGEEGLKTPAGNTTGTEPNTFPVYGPPNNLVSMAPEALAPAGGDQPHNNLQPYLTFYFNIALQGVFPPRG